MVSSWAEKQRGVFENAERGRERGRERERERETERERERESERERERERERGKERVYTNKSMLVQSIVQKGSLCKGQEIEERFKQTNVTALTLKMTTDLVVPSCRDKKHRVTSYPLSVYFLSLPKNPCVLTIRNIPVPCIHIYPIHT